MSVAVHVRVRKVPQSIWACNEIALYRTDGSSQFLFDKVHSMTSSNKSLYDSVAPLIHKGFTDGVNVTVLAYGQTGSGKTWSQVGSAVDPGVIPRAAELLLSLLAQSSGSKVEMSCLEIYNEEYHDLLRSERTKVQSVGELVKNGLSSTEDFRRCFGLAESGRKHFKTALNDHSSRSHMILSFHITRPNNRAASVVNLVDLAGSESAARANTCGQQLLEGGNINKSLLALGGVVSAIVSNAPHVPFRDSMLTQALQTSLGGRSLTLFLCCINPSQENCSTSIETLNFARKAMKMKADPTVTLSTAPLFMSQYAASVAAMGRDVAEIGSSHYEKGVADTYGYCLPTVSNVVQHYNEQVSGSLHELVNMQRLLLAHVHAQGIAQLDGLRGQLATLRDQKQRSHNCQLMEIKRQRDNEEEMGERRKKASRLEQQCVSQRVAIEEDIAQWQQQHADTLATMFSPLHVVAAEERALRSGVVHEELEELATISRSFVLVMRQCFDEVVPSQMLQSGAGSATSSFVGKKETLLGLQKQVEAAARQLDDLESAHEMIQAELPVTQTHHHEFNNATAAAAAQAPTAAPHSSRDTTMTPATQQLDESFAVNDAAEIDAKIRTLEREERELHVAVVREGQEESDRRTRNALAAAAGIGKPQKSRSQADTGNIGGVSMYVNLHQQQQHRQSATPQRSSAEGGSNGTPCSTSYVSPYAQRRLSVTPPRSQTPKTSRLTKAVKVHHDPNNDNVAAASQKNAGKSLPSTAEMRSTVSLLKDVQSRFLRTPTKPSGIVFDSPSHAAAAAVASLMAPPQGLPPQAPPAPAAVAAVVSKARGGKRGAKKEASVSSPSQSGGAKKPRGKKATNSASLTPSKSAMSGSASATKEVAEFVNVAEPIIGIAARRRAENEPPRAAVERTLFYMSLSPQFEAMTSSSRGGGRRKMK